ncbi:MAG: zinc ribbon domain-containing protein, partial [Lentisphaeria bacterium]|nr:zinc ribbon domain-containing protein [Lentisphaeria bacterium]
MSQCPKCGRELKPGAKFCGGCGMKIEAQPASNACPKCGRELNPGAKFCGGCGTPVSQVAVAKTLATTCPKCGRELKPGAKFCGGCGTPVGQQSATNTPAATAVAAEPATNIQPQMTTVGGFITWNILPGEIATRIDAADIAEYGSGVKGIIVPEGLKALIFSNGQFLCEVGGGQYSFSDGSQIDPQKKTSLGRRLLSAFASVVPESIRNFFRSENTSLLTFVLIRTGTFPMLLEFNDFLTATVSTNIGLNASCEIADYFEFYRNLMLDAKSIGFASLVEKIKPA